MSEQTSQETETAAGPRWWWWLLAGLVILLLVWLGLQFGASRPLKPFQETAGPGDITINGQPLLVDFDGLNDNPAEFANKRIRVSGSYLRLESPDCELFSGPRIAWGLVAEGLQLNALGFEVLIVFF